ncbi:MAG: sigma-70 family RNA polymerase sigma factor [Planctomycetia bacterium]|nr:sigma-70 family RNA polymerase sigma factor [Planctomycetia bacterium]
MSESTAPAVRHAAAQTLDFSNRTDADLFEWMALAGTCIAKAHAAFAEFHQRHAAYLFAACERRYRGEAEEIVAETLRRVYESAPRFDRSLLANVSATDTARQLVRAWIGQIVRWVAADHFASRKHQPQTVTPACISSLSGPRCSDPTQTTDADSELVTRVRSVIESLPEREQTIAWTIAHGWSPEHGQVRWSQEDLDAIAGRFGLSRENIRQIRTRLIQKLRALLEPLLNGTITGEQCPPTNQQTQTPN